MANPFVRLWRRWTLPAAHVRVIGDAESDEQAQGRYWRENPAHDGCRVEVIRRKIIKPINPDSPTQH